MLSLVPGNSLARQPPRPPICAMPPPSKICASTSMPVRLMTPVPSLGVAGRLGSCPVAMDEGRTVLGGDEEDTAVEDDVPVAADIVCVAPSAG